MLVVIGSFRLPPGQHSAARDAMAKVIAASRAEAGCIAYAFAEDVIEAGLYRVSELWANQAALDAHFATPHMDVWRAEREALGMTDREISSHELRETR